MSDESSARIESDLGHLITRITDGRGSVVPGSFGALTGGYDTQVFAFSVSGTDSLPPELVLRVFRSEHETGRAKIESAVHNAAADAGYPVPRVFAGFSGERVANRPFILMERVKGASLMESASDPEAMKEMPKLMGRVHSSLHSIDSSGLAQTLERQGFDITELMGDRLVGWIDQAVEACGVSQMRPIVKWLAKKAPAASDRLSVCHGDFHPGNMMVDEAGLTGIIDWSNIKFGRPEFDVGFTSMLFKCSPVEAFGPEEAVRAMLEQAATAYISFYKEHAPLDDGMVTYYETLRAAKSLTRVLGKGSGAAAKFVAPDGYAWGSPSSVRAMTRLIERNTGISITV